MVLILAVVFLGIVIVRGIHPTPESEPAPSYQPEPVVVQAPPEPDLCLEPHIGPYMEWCPQYDPTAIDRWSQGPTPTQPPIEGFNMPDVDFDRPHWNGPNINWCRKWWC